MAVAMAPAAVVGPAQNLVLLQMDVNRVLPITPWIHQEPILRAVLRHGEAELVTVRKPVIDDPLAVVAIKTEVSGDARRDDAGQLIERRVRRRVDTVVGDGTADPELDTGHALAGGKRSQLGPWPSSCTKRFSRRTLVWLPIKLLTWLKSMMMS